MNPEKAAQRLIPALYDAAVREASMESMMAEFGHFLNGHMVGIQLRHPGLDRPPVIYTHDSDPASAHLYEKHFHEIDPGPELLRSARRGNTVDTGREIGEEQTLRSEYYADFLRPHGLAWGPTYITLLEKQGRTPVSSFFISRLHRARRLGPAEQQLLQIMIPHLISARQVWATLDAAAAREREFSADEAIPRKKRVEPTPRSELKQGGCHQRDLEANRGATRRE